MSLARGKIEDIAATVLGDVDSLVSRVERLEGELPQKMEAVLSHFEDIIQKEDRRLSSILDANEKAVQNLKTATTKIVERSQEQINLAREAAQEATRATTELELGKAKLEFQKDALKAFNQAADERLAKVVAQLNTTVSQLHDSQQQQRKSLLITAVATAICTAIVTAILVGFTLPSKEVSAVAGDAPVSLPKEAKQ